MSINVRSLCIATLLLLGSLTGVVQSQAPRRALPVLMSRDTLERPWKLDSARVRAGHAVIGAAVQDSARQCRSTKGYVLFGGFIGFIVGSARYEKGQEHGDGDFSLFTRPLVVAPYVLGGMLLGHLIAPC